MRLINKVTGIVAGGGIAALVAGLISSGGIGAAFSSSAQADVNIDVGTLTCELSNPTGDSRVEITNLSAGSNQAEITLDTIMSSAADSDSASVTLTNTGSIPFMATWSVNSHGTGPRIHAMPAAASTVLAAGDEVVVDLGFTWDDLNNNDQGRNPSAIYKVSCDELPSFVANGWLFADGTVGESSVSWTGSAVALVVNGNTKDAQDYPWGPSAGIRLMDVISGSGLPASAPNYTRQNSAWDSAGPRLDIELSNGAIVRGYSWNSTQPLGWEYPGQQSGHATWADVLQYITTAGSPTVVSATIVMDSANNLSNHSDEVTCVNWSGTPLFGSC